jgi:hypothetical protein
MQKSASPPGTPLPNKLPENVSWRETLPTILQWLADKDAQPAINTDLHERHQLMRPPTRSL